MVLCGVCIPHDRGLLGHSDADAALHAVTDALLGTIGAGDIGQHFPPSDERWRDCDSGVFLRHARGLVEAQGGRVENVDLVIVCERPTTSSDSPPPYTLAVSIRFPLASTNASRMAKASPCSVSVPNPMVPRARFETLIPVPGRLRYFTE